MNRAERTIVILLRIVGIGGLLAIPAVIMPFTWMNGVHRFMGLGELPDAPIVHYLARSLSGFYAIVGGITLTISTDIRRYRLFVKLWGATGMIVGLGLLGIDLTAGMPASWTATEGPPAFLVGLIVWKLHPQIAPFQESAT